MAFSGCFWGEEWTNEISRGPEGMVLFFTFYILIPRRGWSKYVCHIKFFTQRGVYGNRQQYWLTINLFLSLMPYLHHSVRKHCGVWGSTLVTGPTGAQLLKILNAYQRPNVIILNGIIEFLVSLFFTFFARNS